MKSRSEQAAKVFIFNKCRFSLKLLRIAAAKSLFVIRKRMIQIFLRIDKQRKYIFGAASCVIFKLDI